VLDADWTSDSDGLSDVAWYHGHQGGRHAPRGLNLVNFRFRELITPLGRWEKQDPAGYVDSNSLYSNRNSNPYIFVDPEGNILFLIPAIVLGVAIGGAGYGIGSLAITAYEYNTALRCNMEIRKAAERTCPMLGYAINSQECNDWKRNQRQNQCGEVTLQATTGFS
jgi:RHS repeat-associated protein